MKDVWKVLAAMVCLVLLGSTTTFAADNGISVAGSSTVRPIVEKAAKEFKRAHPDVQFVIGGGGSSHGVKAVGTGDVLIGMASRNLKDKEKTQWEDLVTVRIGLDGIAMIVNSKNPVNAITKQQIQDIYTGKISNWKELGGHDAPILLVGKEEGRSTLDLFLKYFDLEAQEVIKGGKAVGMVHRKNGAQEYAEAEARLIGPNREALAVVSVKRNVIAYVSVGTAQEVANKGGRIKLLELDGVAASIDNVANETYPLRRPLHVVTKGQPAGVVQQFIRFLTNDKGQAIVASLEFITVKQEL